MVDLLATVDLAPILRCCLQAHVMLHSTKVNSFIPDEVETELDKSAST